MELSELSSIETHYIIDLQLNRVKKQNLEESIMKLLESKHRKLILNKLDKVKNLFKDKKNVLNSYHTQCKILTSHLLILYDIIDSNYENKSDFDLIMYCGKIKSYFCAADTPYTKQQHKAINKLLDTISLMSAEYGNK